MKRHHAVGGIVVSAGLSLLAASPPAHPGAMHAVSPVSGAAVRPAPPLVAAPPLVFEKNEGQVTAPVSFLARGRGFTLYLTPAEAVFRLRAGRASDARREAATLRLTPVGARSDVRPRGADRQHGTTNYLVGEPHKWRTNIPSYSRVVYEQVYPGIDLVYYGREGRLEYDFIVAPGADPGAIALEFASDAGRAIPHVDAGGALVVPVADGSIRFSKPILYQPDGAARRAVDGAYVVRRDGRTAFTVGEYDPRRPLVIDPVLESSTLIGGSGEDSITDVAVGLDGAVHVVGMTASVDFPSESPRPEPRDELKRYDAFITKLTPDGRSIVWSTYLGGTQNDYATGVAVDASGNIYVGGEATSNDFPTMNAFLGSLLGGTNVAFVTKLSPAGTLLYSTYLGGADIGSSANALAADDSGNVFVVGSRGSGSSTFGTPFPTRNAFQDESNSQCTDSVALFMAQIDTTKSGDGSLVYSTLVCAGPATETNDLARVVANDVAVDVTGKVHVAGWTNSPHLPTRNAYQATCAACDSFHNLNAIVLKIDPSKSGDASLEYATYLGGRLSDFALAIAVDAAGFTYVAGHAVSSDFPTTSGVLAPTFNNSNQGFAAKLDTNLSGDTSLVWATYLGGRGHDFVTAIALGTSGDVYVAGVTDGQLPTRAPAQPDFGGGIELESSQEQPSDAFAMRLSADGARLLYSTYLGGSHNEHPRHRIDFFTDAAPSIAMDANGHAWVAGGTRSPDFPILGGFQRELLGLADGFLSRLVLWPHFALGDIPPATIEAGNPGQTTVTVESLDDFSAAVSLATTTAPAGFGFALLPAAVTPPANLEAISTLVITPNLSVLPGEYSVTVTGTSESLADAATASITVVATPGGTADVIDGLTAITCIDNGGVSSALLAKLDRAQAFIDAGLIQPAINTLTALLHQLRAQAGKHITTSCVQNGQTFDAAAVLIAHVETLLQSLGGTAMAAPVMGFVTAASGAPLEDVTVSLFSSASRKALDTAETDATGFFYFPSTDALRPDVEHRATVALPRRYKSASPSMQTFTWRGAAFWLQPFILK